MSDLDRLHEAARYNDAQAEELNDSLGVFHELGWKPREVDEFAQQRALRIYAYTTNQHEALRTGGRVHVGNEPLFQMLKMMALDGLATMARAVAIGERNG